MSEHKFTNALAGETSPYLLQHAHNPVNWYPWSEEALRRAREEDKPILLSIGYSACHWCHVMEHESFENESIARLMNEYFINIKVDREERPDLDTIYMTAVQMMSGHGGWPMTVFLTPDGVPFYGGTYFPPEDRHGMPGLPRLLLSVAGAYKEKKEAIHKEAATIVQEMQRINSIGAAPGKLSSEILDSAIPPLMANYDSQHGGFGGAPKFPPSMSLSFLLRSYARTSKPELLQAVEHTLQKMACGGVYDQLGGGFHRYSVDQYWLVPHFEKMLYDNALLSRIYLDAYLVTKNDLYRRIAEETLDYVRREMTSPEGGFYSTQDADSEGHEGKFFVWTPREVASILGAKDADLFCRCFDITDQGNFEGKNILNLPRPVSVVARLNKISEDELHKILLRGRRLLFEEREKRIKPGRDEKILTAWNGLMLRSFAEAAVALDRRDYRDAAARNAEFVLSKLQRDGRLLRSYKDGEAKFNAYLEDYSCMVDGLLSVYEATFNPRWITEARRLAELMVNKFWDPEARNFYFTSGDHEALIHRPKDFYDNATPSGNSVAAHALLRLAELTGEVRWQDYARSVLEAMATVMANHPAAFSNFLCALDFSLASPMEIAVVGIPDSEQTRKLLRVVTQRYQPNKVIACGTDAHVGLLRNRPQTDGMATAYLCRNQTCSAPVTSAEDLERLLKEF
jgi:uncharacterized protein YyaL (SSP411 family)